MRSTPRTAFLRDADEVFAMTAPTPTTRGRFGPLALAECALAASLLMSLASAWRA